MVGEPDRARLSFVGHVCTPLTRPARPSLVSAREGLFLGAVRGV